MDQQQQALPALLATDLDYYFEQLMSVYQHRLYAFALRQVGNTQDAEDIVQEAFLRAYHALKDYPIPRIQALHLQQWLYKITLNVFRNHARGFEPQTVPLDMSEDSPYLEIEDQTIEPEREVDRCELRQELEMRLTALPQPYRLTVDLHYFEEMSHREIAELLHLPSGTIKAHVHRGIHLLRKALATQQNEMR